jgi:hypothetical protein
MLEYIYVARDGVAGDSETVAMVPDDATGKEDNAVKQLKDSEAQLVNGEPDGRAVRSGHVPEHLDNVWPP